MEPVYDLDAGAGDPAKKVLSAAYLGWSGICVVQSFDAGYRDFLSALGAAGKVSQIEVFAGAMITAEKPQEVEKKARAALEAGADIVLVAGGDPEINRAASECWEVDILCHPEKVSGRDLPDQKNSGLDHVMAGYMAERCMAIEINFSELLYSYGMVRSQMMGRMRQNVMLAKKYDVPLIIASGGDAFSLRAPEDLYSVCITLGMDAGFAKKVLAENPSRMVKKARDRKDPNVLMKGVSIVSRPDGEPSKRKKMSGWY